MIGFSFQFEAALNDLDSLASSSKPVAVWDTSRSDTLAADFGTTCSSTSKWLGVIALASVPLIRILAISRLSSVSSLLAGCGRTWIGISLPVAITLGTMNSPLWFSAKNSIATFSVCGS